MPRFVLKGKYGADLKHADKFFRCWTVIGPCATRDIAEAERFDTAQEAMLSPAYSHWSSDYEPHELTD